MIMKKANNGIKKFCQMLDIKEKVDRRERVAG